MSRAMRPTAPWDSGRPRSTDAARNGFALGHLHEGIEAEIAGN